MNWIFYDTDLAVDSVPADNPHGFIYLIVYDDNSKYVGKKDFFSYSTLPALKSGKQRPNSERIVRNRNGKRVYFDRVRKESKWKSYTGSTKLVGDRKIVSKYILAFGQSKRHLTYLEVKYLFECDVLEDSSYLNENILGKFYKDNLI